MLADQGNKNYWILLAKISSNALGEILLSFVTKCGTTRLMFHLPRSSQRLTLWSTQDRSVSKQDTYKPPKSDTLLWHFLPTKNTHQVCNHHPQICLHQMKAQPAFSKSYFLMWGVSVLTEWYLISFLWETDGDVSTGTRDSWLSDGKWLSVFARLRKLCWGNVTDCSIG